MSGPRILLFGSPSSGKSSLLGALVQAAELQPALLKGTLVDESGALLDLHKKTYQANTEPTDALTRYDLQVQPEGSRSRSQATVLDTSGAAARDMMLARQPFLVAHPMKQPLLEADTVLLVVDAAMPGKQLADEFQQFARWIMQFHETRGKRTDIGGLPVFLVLTKCDMLAKPNDTLSQWMQRIEEGKRRIDEKFRIYLKKQGTGFGTIQLRLWATAIKRPALADRAAKAQEPYGVAELFRQCLQSASDYQQRRQTSQYRLHNLFIGMTGIVALLIAALTFLVEFQPEAKHSTLEEKLQTALPKKGADRLNASVKNLEKKRALLSEIESDPDFASLPSESQQAIVKYRAELSQYLEMYNEAQTRLKPPQMAKNESEYRQLKKTLEGFELPAEHAEEWKKTKLGQRIQLLRAEFTQVDKELKTEEAWFREQIKLNDSLHKQGVQIYSKLLDQQKVPQQEIGLWDLACREQLHPKSRKPREQYIETTRMTYEDLDKFEQIQKVEKRWIETKTKLKQDSDNIQDQLKLSS